VSPIPGAPAELRTERLLLRRWEPGDEAPMVAINRDPEVTRYLNSPVSEAALAAFHPYLVEHWHRHGFGPWALEAGERIASRDGGAEISPGTFLGFAGVAFPTYLPAVAERPEIGWRLTRRAWGRGLATEAALAARDHAFGALGLGQLIAIIHPDNARSQAVARRLGMGIAQHVHNPLLGRFVDVWTLAAPAAG
jgi:RimJ/RimL family protein N-acetyltransferase